VAYAMIPPVIGRIRRQVIFSLERFLLGGTQYRLMFLAALIGIISVAGGILVYLQDAGRADLATEIWWAFLRLTDPGYLGDDEGAFRRVVSTIITVLGYVLFLGALIAVMTQWLNSTIRQLEQGLTPIVKRNHVVILGWTSRSPEVLRELLASTGRIRRFLRRLGARKLQIAILVPDVDLDLVVQLRELLGPRYRRTQVILRSGSPLQIDHLRRVDYARAAVLIVPGSDQNGPEELANSDARTIKTLLTVRQYAALDAKGPLPLMVAAVNNTRVVDVAEAAYGQDRAQIVATDDMVGRLMAQNVRHAGLSYVLNEILSHDEGSEIYLKAATPWVGKPIGSLRHAFSDGIVIGLLRGVHNATPLLNPPAAEVITEEDRLVVLAVDYDLAQSSTPTCPLPEVSPRASAHSHEPPARRILILGWNHTLPTVLKELDRHPQERLQIDLMSTIGVKGREKRLRQSGVTLNRISLNHIEGDYAVPGDLSAIDMTTYHNILIAGSDRFDTAEDADARTLLGYYLVREMVERAAKRPHMLVELRDPSNADLFADEDTEVLATGEILSHVIAQIALRADLRLVFDLLLGPEGPEIMFRPISDFALPASFSFAELIDAAARHGETALGMRLGQQAGSKGGIVLNPPRLDRFATENCNAVVVLTTWSNGDAA
jgi:ion channel POLLUX/CASTOR